MLVFFPFVVLAGQDRFHMFQWFSEVCRLHEVITNRNTTGSYYCQIPVLRVTAASCSCHSCSLSCFKACSSRLEHSEPVTSVFRLREPLLHPSTMLEHLEDMKGNIRVFCRFRPLGKREQENGDIPVLHKAGQGKGSFSIRSCKKVPSIELARRP